MKQAVVIFSFLIFTGNMVNGQESNRIIAPGAKVEKLAEHFSFTEGPAVDKAGNVYFTDQPNNRIWKWSAADGELSVFLEQTGRANGTYFDQSGHLLSCSDIDRKSTRLNSSH